MAEFSGKVGHLEGIESPFGNAGGVVKTLEDVEAMARTGVGWIEAGSYTLEGRNGNKWDAETQSYKYEKDWDYNPETGVMHNSLGMPNKGMDIVETEIPEMIKIAHIHNKKLVVNVAPVTDDPAAETYELVRRAYDAHADAVIVNGGCPNVKNEDGTAHLILSRQAREFGAVFTYMKEQGLFTPVWARSSPQTGWGEMNLVASYLKSAGNVSALLHTNTWVVPMPVGENGEPLLDVPMAQVGKSGPAMRVEAEKETYWAEQALRGSGIDVIRSSGVMAAEDIRLSLDMGAVACAGTTFFYASENGWQDDVGRLLTDLAA